MTSARELAVRGIGRFQQRTQTYMYVIEQFAVEGAQTDSPLACLPACSQPVPAVPLECHLQLNLEWRIERKRDYRQQQTLQTAGVVAR